MGDGRACNTATGTASTISKERSPNYLFLDLIELSDQTSATILQASLNCLNQNGFCDDYIQENLVAFASNGTSVMLGKQSGVAQNFAEKYPNIILCHCMNHRIELAVSDSVDDVGAVNHFQIFMDKLYTPYRKSSKNQRESAECSRELDLQLIKIGRILAVWYDI
ncbi:E3 SUMO-protein ligase KIAA1586 [Araneus ventricosus]|uniref:E3 SUMO-protein ligase KIAA1586 n=1 Tax=Araneus ventricosus TaxID=182803 RepID=A0A4Y2SV51_ARAVE|nr:E3 SUMO-protein ligase KIAA1586 [Araneus ventricosus]